jgi:hemolysin activation/secretion protein
MGRVVCSSGVILVVVNFGLATTPERAQAQTPSPSQFTPQSLRPSAGPRDAHIALPQQGSLTPPSGAEGLTVQIEKALVEGSFPELAQSIEILVRGIAGRRLSVAQIYDFARAIERTHMEAGYPLVRVVVPPQKLVDQGKLVVVVIDGFIEEVDVAAVPERVRKVVASRMRKLVGLRHVRLAEIQRCLLLAGDVPGLRLRSTLMPGASTGGAKLVLEGEHQIVSTTFGGDDSLSKSLGTWQLKGSVGVNGAAGFGELIYGTIGSSADLNSALAGKSRLLVYGGGVVVPVGNNGLTVNPEYSRSTTRTARAPGVPASNGSFERFALRLRHQTILTRESSLSVSGSIERITQQVDAPEFEIALSRDQYWALRGGADFATRLPGGGNLQLNAKLSQGLGGRGELDVAQSGVPLSRMGASSSFSKLAGYGRVSQPLPLAELRVDLIGAGQFAMGKPMLRSEQFALDGSDAISAFSGGTFSVDEGATMRGELSRSFAAKFETANLLVSPYLFGAVGRGWLSNATSVEQSVINAGAVGIGTRGAMASNSGWPAFNFGVELARQFTDAAWLRPGWRGNVNAAVIF